MEYFTKIQEPKKLRISMMMAARDSIIIISMLDAFAEIRKQKAELVVELRDDFKEINGLCKQLTDIIADEKTRREALDSLKPKVDSQKITAKPISKQKVKETESVIPQAIPSAGFTKQKTDVDRLEYTLAQIEQKLAELQK